MGHGPRLAQPRASRVSLAVRAAPLAPERWQQIQQVLADAIECSPHRRKALIEGLCVGDPVLRREVESLLEAHEAEGIVDRLAPLLMPPSTWEREARAEWSGRSVGHYRVQEPIGCGGMSVVYKARDERLGREVALKFLSPSLGASPRHRKALLDEARAAAAINHPNVCRIHETGESDDGHVFIVMELYEGDTLEGRVERGRLTFREALPIALQIARGLGRAHESGIVHRDVKPSNILILPGGTVKILDFGIAHIEDGSHDDTQPLAGTIAYMSPEQAMGLGADRRSDIWSLGVVLHEMLTGTRPFDGQDSLSVRQAILEQEPRLTSSLYDDIPAGIEPVLRKALAKTPRARYASMPHFAAALCGLARSDAHSPRRFEELCA